MAYTVKDILRLEVAPALGCTEPVATALGAAAAVSILPGKEIDSNCNLGRSEFSTFPSKLSDYPRKWWFFGSLVVKYQWLTG